jgi:hypothetical protein
MPLSYLVYDHAKVTNEIVNMEYGMTEDCLIATMVPQGLHYVTLTIIPCMMS